MLEVKNEKISIFATNQPDGRCHKGFFVIDVVNSCKKEQSIINTNQTLNEVYEY